MTAKERMAGRGRPNIYFFFCLSSIYFSFFNSLGGKERQEPYYEWSCRSVVVGKIVMYKGPTTVASAAALPLLWPFAPHVAKY